MTDKAQKGEEVKILFGWSTGFFGFQILVSGVAHLLGSSPGTVAFAAALAVLFVALLVIVVSPFMIPGYPPGFAISRAIITFVATCAAFAALGVALVFDHAPALLPVADNVFVFAVFSGAFAMLAATLAAGFIPKEKFVVLFLSALPFGIGTVGGGVIFLLRRCCAAKNVAA